MARRSGCSVATVRYHESIGLLDPAARTAADRRTYGRSDVTRLLFVRRARDFGMSIEQVRTLLAAAVHPDIACADAQKTVLARLDDVATKRAELRRLETALKVILQRCGADCADHSRCCTIFDDIETWNAGGRATAATAAN